MDNPVADHIDPAAAMTSDGIPTHNQAPNATTDHNSSPVAINPVHDVFNTFELCENILSYISTYDLSRAKRVSRHFGEVIERSPRLQRNLFQEPRTSTTLSATRTTRVPGTTRPSLVLPLGPSTGNHSVTTDPKGNPTKGVVIYEKHPALQRHGWRQGKKTPARYVGYRANDIRASTPLRTNVIDRVSSMSQDSALHNTYICQPPVTHILVAIGSEWFGMDHLDIHDDSGITFGHLRKVLTEFKRGGTIDPFWHHDTRPVTTFDVHFYGGLPVDSEHQRAA
jgi:hypothetical protein